MERDDGHAMTSDEIDEMYCELCKMKGRSRTAESFCVDCIEYFCSSCMKSHSYFLPTHIQKDKSSMPQDVCLKPCPTHSAEIIKFYCSACEQFFCSLCRKKDHSQCNTVSHLPELVQAFDMTRTLNEVNTKIENTIKVVETRESKVNEKSKLACEYAENAKSALQFNKTLVLQWLERNVENIEHEIETIRKDDENTLHAEGSALSAIKDQSNTLKTRLNSKTLMAKRCEFFMTLKETESLQEQIEEKLRQVEEHIATFYEFESSDDCGKLLEDRSLGKIERKMSTTKDITSESSVINDNLKSTESVCVADVTSRQEETSVTPKVLKANKNVNVYELPDIETQKLTVAQYMQRPLVQGELWYVVESIWFKQWKCYVGYDSWDTYHVGEESAHPGPIDNTPILKETSELKEHLIDDLDFILLPEDCWKQLLAWYGMVYGQDPLPRKVITEGVYTKSLKVEVYPWHLKLCEHTNLDNYLPQVFSRVDTIGALEQKMREMFGIAAEIQVRLWNRYTNMYEHLTKKDFTLQDAGLYQGQVVIIERQSDDGTWPCDNLNWKKKQQK